MEALCADGLPPLAARILASRGIQNRAELALPLAALDPPQSVAGAEQCAAILAEAIEHKRPICVIGDYDADGLCATAIAVEALRAMGAIASYLIPDRRRDGYGVSPALVARAAQNGAQVLLTVDNGVGAHQAAQAAKEAGLILCITDHHLPGERLPPAACVVNPHLSDGGGRNLCGAGVALYVMLALRARLRHPVKLAAALDLAALATVADSAQADRNNRILVAHGIRRIRSGLARPGLRAIFNAAGRKEEEVTVRDLGFAVAPRINAAGRIGDPEIAMQCLLAADEPAAAGEAAAAAAAQTLSERNEERKQIQRRAEAEARILAAEQSGRAALAVCNPDWNEGVIGLIAATISGEWNRPTVAFARDSADSLKGSARIGGGDFHLRHALDAIKKELPQVVLRYGGHAQAAGITIAADGLDAFAAAFHRQAEKHPPTPGRELDPEPPLQEITYAAAEALAEIHWGPGFPEPQFAGRFQVRSRRSISGGHFHLMLARDGATFAAAYFRPPSPPPDNPILIYRIQPDTYLRRPRLIVDEVLEE